MFELEPGCKILQILPAPSGMYATDSKVGHNAKMPVLYVALIQTEGGCTYMENITIIKDGEYAFLRDYLPFANIHLPSYTAMWEHRS